MPAELQSARIKAADFAQLAKLRWSSQQLVAAMRLFHQATGHFRRANLQVLCCAQDSNLASSLTPGLSLTLSFRSAAQSEHAGSRGQDL